MLFSKPTKYGAGIILYGDYWDLKNLHSTFHDAVGDESFDDQSSDFVLALAYDVRKAYERQRERLNATHFDDETISYYGVKILWPIFLVQVGLLRWMAAFRPTTKSHQADLFRLEACADEALEKYDPSIGKQCSEWLSTFRGFPTHYNFDLIYAWTREYVSRGKPGKIRFKLLPDVLGIIALGSTEYLSFTKNLKSIMDKEGIRLNGSHNIEDWGPFKW